MYVKKLTETVAPGGFLFINSPAFGEDVVWGNVFPIYVQSWQQDVAAGRPFRDLHVDDEGYPHHGHLIWASPQWWTEQFTAGGFVREVDIEKALHRVYDADFERESLARKAFFVFSPAGVTAARQPGRSQHLLRDLKSTKFEAVGPLRLALGLSTAEAR